MGKILYAVLAVALALPALLYPIYISSFCSADVTADGWGTADSGTDNGLRDIWGFSPTAIFAVGEEGTLLRYGGASWGSLMSGTTADINGIWGTSPTDFFVVGQGGVIRHFILTGSNPMDSGTGVDLHAVWGTDTDDVFAVGDGGTILYYNGSVWTAMDSGVTNDLYGVWGSSSKNFFAVGEDGIILRYGGSDWAPMVSGTDEVLRDIWGNSASEIFVVGDGATILEYESAWTPMTTPGTLSFCGVWGDRDDLFVIGREGTTGNGVIWHYDGGKWGWMDIGTDEWLYDVWGSASTDVYVVGEAGTILHYWEHPTVPTATVLPTATTSPTLTLAPTSTQPVATPSRTAVPPTATATSFPTETVEPTPEPGAGGGSSTWTAVGIGIAVAFIVIGLIVWGKMKWWPKEAGAPVAEDVVEVGAADGAGVAEVAEDTEVTYDGGGFTQGLADLWGNVKDKSGNAWDKSKETLSNFWGRFVDLFKRGGE
jgi:hypothetical protein